MIVWFRNACDCNTVSARKGTVLYNYQTNTKNLRQGNHLKLPIELFPKVSEYFTSMNIYQGTGFQKN